MSSLPNSDPQFMSEDVSKLALALSKVQGEVGLVPKTKTAKVPMKSGGSYSYSYADLADIWEAIRSPLKQNELAITQVFNRSGEVGYIQTFLIHSSGQWVKSELKMGSFEKIQELGSAITYLRRYAISSILGIATDEDEDGGLANQAPQKSSYAKPYEKRPSRSADMVAEPEEESIEDAFHFKFRHLPRYDQYMELYLDEVTSRGSGLTVQSLKKSALTNLKFVSGYTTWLVEKEKPVAVS